MKKIMIVSALVAAVAGCQTYVMAEKYPEVLTPIQDVVEVNGKQVLATKDVIKSSGGWYAKARSPLYATEALKGLMLGVETNGTVRLELDAYHRDLSTNSVAMVGEMFSGGAQLVTAIGDAYVKIAGGGAQASTVLSSAQKIYEYFVGAGGDASKATVTTADGKVKVTDGTTCVTCDASGNCAPCAD